MSDYMFSMAAAVAKAAVMAEAQHGAALILHPYGGPPPEAEFFLAMMRGMIEEDGETMGVICVGLGQETGMLPLWDAHPVSALEALLDVRQQQAIPSVDWVVLALDTYVTLTDDPDSPRGTARAAFQAGHPAAYEALSVLCVAPDGPGYDVQQRYTRAGDAIDWEQPTSVREAVTGGAVRELMKELVLA